MTSTVGRIRAIRTAAGYGFDLTHVPEQGIWHLHIIFYLPPDKPVKDFDKGKRNELKYTLQKSFGDLVAYSPNIEELDLSDVA